MHRLASYLGAGGGRHAHAEAVQIGEFKLDLPAYPAGLEGFTGLVLASQPEPLSIRIDSINVDVGVAGNDLGKAAHQAIAGVEFQTISGLALGGIVDRAVTLVDGAAQPVSQTNGGLAELLLDVQFALGAPDHTPWVGSPPAGGEWPAVKWRNLAALVVALGLGAKAMLLAPLTPVLPLWLASAALAALLEWRAVPLQAGAYFSAAPALYLALILWGGSGVRLALVAALLGLAVRWFTRGQAQPQEAPGVLADFLPVAATALAHAQSPHPFILLDVYLLIGYVAPGWLIPGRSPARGRVRILWLSACLLGPVWASLTPAWL